MSKPTQAQIEAAANELRQYALSLVGKEWNIEYVARRILTAAAETQDAAYKRGFEDCQQGRTNKYAAITAAAEVGEKDLLAICLERIEATGKALEAATIERCAQVAKAAAAKALEDHQRCKDSKDAAVDHYLWCHDEAVAIEAAIRALKD